MFLSFNKVFKKRTNAIVVEIGRACSSNNGANSSNAGTLNSVVNFGKRFGK